MSGVSRDNGERQGEGYARLCNDNGDVTPYVEFTVGVGGGYLNASILETLLERFTKDVTPGCWCRAWGGKSCEQFSMGTSTKEKKRRRTSLLLRILRWGRSKLFPPCSEVVLCVEDARGLRPIVIEGGGGGHRRCCPRG